MDRVVLNIGGQRYETTMSTLSREPRKYFGSRGRRTLVKISGPKWSRIFFRQRPRPFSLRFKLFETWDRRRFAGQKQTLQELKVEAVYFGMNGLQRLIDQHLSQPGSTKFQNFLGLKLFFN